MTIQGDSEWWSRPDGSLLIDVHPADACQPPCPLHAPSDHHMRDWPLHWRDDWRFFERLCPHGVGHPDPDDLWFKRQRGMPSYGVHGCDGCCRCWQLTDGA